MAGTFWGSDATAEQELWQRVDQVLPADLAQSTVIDIGASKGLFAFEAAHRGAAHVMAVEKDTGCVDFMRRLRSAEAIPLATCQVDAMTQPLPRLWLHGVPVRYDVALLLNVLHWSLTPEVLLRKTLDICDRCIIETPFTVGKTPYRDPHGSWPDLQCLPPMWVQERAAENGFRVAAMANSTFYPGYRMIFRLERVTTCA